MIASRNKIAGAKVGSKKKKPEQPSKPKMVKPRPAWDSFLVPDSEYKLKTEKMLAKKKLLVSTHNIFTTETDVAVGSKPRPVLKERNLNISSPAESKFAVKKEKKETDALDLIMSTKDKILDNSPSSKSPPARGTSSFALPTKTTRQKTAKKATTSEETEPKSKSADLFDLLDNEDGDELALSTQLFGQSASQIHDTVTEVVKDNRERCIAEHTYQLHQSGLLDTDKASTNKDVLAKKSIRTSAPRAGSNGRGTRPAATTSSTTPSTAFNTSFTSTSPTSSHPMHTTRARGLNSSTAQSIASRTEKDYDLIYVADEVRSLFAELKYYEELSGRQSILDTRQELDEMLHDEALLHPEQHKPVMRYLVQLVCQSMTYLLKSEVDLQEERSRYESLNAKFETLNNFLSDDSAAPGLYELKKNLENNATNATTANIGANSGIGGNGSSGVTIMSGSEYLAKHSNTNTATSPSALPSTSTSTGAKVNDSVDQGIAYSESDLYPSQFNTPIATRTNHNTTTTTNPNTTNTSTSNSYTRTEAPSPSLRMIAQQYAQDDLYPIPLEADGEHSQYNYDCEEYDSFDFEPSFTLSATKTTPYSSLTQGVHGAKVTSTPARLQEKIATLSGQQEQKAMHLAMNAPPMGLSTPVRSVYHGHSTFHNTTATPGGSSSVQAMHSNVYTSTNGVSSTASTPQVMPYATHYQSKRDYTALGVFSAATTPNTTSNNNNSDYSPYTQLNSPAPYVDAYASFLPSTPPARLASVATQPSNNAVTANTATPLDPVEASLAKVDELIRYSHTIASGSHHAIHTPNSAMLGDEYSTIARLTEHKHDLSHTNYNNNSSMMDNSMYSVHRMEADTSMYSLGAEGSNRQDGTEYNLPLPPPVSATTTTASTKPVHPPSLPIRQPAQASAAHSQLHTTLSNTPSHVNTTSSGSTGSVNSVTSGSGMAGMSGTSPSDWLFGAFTTTPTNTINGTTLSIGQNLNTSGSTRDNNNTTTPVAHYIAPTTTMHTIPATHYTTSNTTYNTINSATGLVTPTREVVRLNANKTQSPRTEDLYKTTSTQHGFISPDLTADRLVEQNYYHTNAIISNTHTSVTSMNSSSSDSVNASTPALQAAVPSYLLHTMNTHNTAEHSQNVKKSHTKNATASGLVQVKGTTPPRHGSPVKAGLKSSRIPQKKSGTTQGAVEQGSVYVPHQVTALPSPQSAPVHPFRMNITTPTNDAALQRKLQHLQHEHNDATCHSNAATPTLALEPWSTVQQRVYDARNGSF